MKLKEKELHVLFNKIKNKDEKEEAFNTLYKDYNKLIYGIAFSILKNKDDSEDVLQTVFAKIYKLSKSKLPEKSEASWLYSVTKNEAITYLRKKNKEVNLDENEIYNIQEENDDLKEIENIDAYRRAINTLNKKEQEIVSLKILSGFSFREIAKILNMPIGTVQWNYYKAMHSLKLLLGNASMFLITSILYMFVNNKAGSRTIELNNSISSNEQVDIDKGTETNITIESSVIDNQEINNTVQEGEILYIQSEPVESSLKDNTINISLLFLSTIFLFFTIIFTIVCFKHCTKRFKVNR